MRSVPVAEYLARTSRVEIALLMRRRHRVAIELQVKMQERVKAVHFGGENMIGIQAVLLAK